MFICLPVSIYFFREETNGLGIAIAGSTSVLLGIISPFLWYTVNIVKFKIWVGKYVKDIHRFHEEALSKRLIYETNFARKIEIKSSYQKKDLTKFYYNRLKESRELIIDINSEIDHTTIFKDNRLVSLIIFTVLILGVLYLRTIREINDNTTYAIVGISIVLIAIEFYKQNKYNYILKIDNQKISYKDNKLLIPWNIINEFRVIFGSRNRSSELIIYTSEKEYKLKLESFSRLKLDRLINVLNENKHRYDIKSSTKWVQQPKIFLKKYEK